MTGSAQLEILPGNEVEEGVTALQRQAAERVAAHRLRRARAGQGSGGDGRVVDAPAQEVGKKNRIAAVVAERYAQTPSYRAFLAAEAERATERAAAAVEIAARNAAAVKAVQQELLAELELWSAPQEFTGETAGRMDRAAAGGAMQTEEAAAETDVAVRQVSAAGLTVRLYEDAGRLPVAGALRRGTEAGGPSSGGMNAEEARALDAEIRFRQAPVFEDFGKAEPTVPIAANLLEFPRQLVATRKARPRLAEGPLREESGPRSPQLRIFEVEPEQISTAPMAASTAPEWSSIWLDAHTVTERVESPEAAVLPSLLPPQTAPLELRIMAAAVDGLLVVGGFVAFAGVFARVAGQVPRGIPAAVGAAGVLGALALLYQVLFFTLTDQTPGMRYARIGLCTFSDENPTRAAMRRRILAKIVAVIPLGIGVLWVLLDDERLGWQDRISRMYQRAY